MQRRKPGDAAEPIQAKTVKRTIVLSAEASKRLDVHAAATGQTCSAVVDDLVVAGLRRFSLVDRGEARGPRLAIAPEEQREAG